METGGDFYNFFVLGFYPALYDPEADDDGVNESNSSAGLSSTVSATITPVSALNSAIPMLSGWDREKVWYLPVADVY